MSQNSITRKAGGRKAAEKEMQVTVNEEKCHFALDDVVK